MLIRRGLSVLWRREGKGAWRERWRHVLHDHSRRIAREGHAVVISANPHQGSGITRELSFDHPAGAQLLNGQYLLVLPVFDLSFAAFSKEYAAVRFKEGR